MIIATALAVLFACVCFAPPTLRRLVWIAIIVLGVVPWLDLQDHPHWWRVGWLPFWSPPVRWRDILINTALYAPLGLFSHRSADARRSRQPWGMLAIAFALSIATETSQSYSHSRFPSATDVTTNVLGAALGWWFAEGVDAARRARQPTSPLHSTPR
jgi:glycopeptide antibiotics resistance protein